MAAFPLRSSPPPFFATLPKLANPCFAFHLSNHAPHPLIFSLTAAPSPACSPRTAASALFAVYGDGLPSPEDANDRPLVDTASAVVVEFSHLAHLKQALVDQVGATDRGLTTNTETRGEIVDLITQMEATNPSSAPTEAPAFFHGKWILLYSSLSELFPLLSAGNLPLVKLGEISQTINSSESTFVNFVNFSTPLGTASFSATASFQICSPKRVQIKFDEGIISSLKFRASIDMPESIDILGQKLDLKPFQGPFQPLQSAADSIARAISGQPPLKFPIGSENSQSWLVTTYLDEDLRISRGDGGSVFVLIRENSPFMK